MPKKTYVIDGSKFDDLEGFYDEVARVLIPHTWWGRNLDAFNDILRGNFGPLDESEFTFVWKNSLLSKKQLGESKYTVLIEIIRSHDHIDLVLE